MKIKKDNCLIPLAFGVLAILWYLVIKIICRGKYDFLHIISGKITFPPMWLFNFIYMISLFLLGVSAGLFVRDKLCLGQSIQTENLFLKGAVFAVAVYFLSLLWYPLLFALQMPLLSLIILLLSVISVVLTLIFWLKACASYGVFVIPITVWLIYLSILNLILIFAI